MSFQVFVSYSSKDLGRVEEIRRIFDRADVSVFVAEHSVKAGDSLPISIIQAIKATDLFMLIWTAEAKESNWVREEIGIARGHEKVILPIVLEEGVELPGFLHGIKYLSIGENPESALSLLNRTCLRGRTGRINRLA